MKKLLLSVAVITCMTACKKENKTIENTAQNKDSAAVLEPTEPIAATIPFKKIELTPAETSKILGKQNNDTLYVNNFFATWCGPCIKEIPHFKEKMIALKDQPVKFTFISLDSKEDWDGAVKNFAEEQNISNHIVLLDGSKLTPDFFSSNFEKWDGGAIPFTFMRKADKTDETLGSMSMEMLNEKINSFK